jgi:hypothetical protein
MMRISGNPASKSVRPGSKGELSTTMTSGAFSLSHFLTEATARLTRTAEWKLTRMMDTEDSAAVMAGDPHLPP